jgi:two-component system, sensor histidine kinase and response regulator
VRVSLQHKVAIGYVLTTLVMVSILVVEFRYIKSLQRDAEAIDHTHQIKEHLTYLLFLVNDIETSTRGYLITGQREFLRPYEAARQAVPAEIETIKNLISDSDEEQQRMRSMEDLLNQKLSLQSEAIRLKEEKGQEAATALVATREGTRIMEEIRRLSKEMEQVEVGLLASRISRKRRTANEAFILTAIVVALVLLVFTLLFLLIRREINQREVVEKELRISYERTEYFFQHASDIIYRTDRQGVITFVSPAVENLMGYRVDEVLGRHYLDPISPSWRDQVEQFYRRQFKDHVPNTYYSFPVLRKDGSEMWVGQNVQLVLEAGQLVGAQALARDVTQDVQLEEEMKRARDAALESARVKSEFLANMSHEIRTPMNGIIGMTSVLSGTKLDPDQRHFVDGIRQSADSLLGVINDILDFSKLEAGKLQISPADFDLRVLIDEVITLFSEPAESKNLELISMIEPDVPVFLRADPSRLRQVLINLLGNAIKFTSHGEVQLTVGCLWETATDTVLRFNVKDTGVGISEEGLSRIFNAFVQADGSTARRFGGSGLGLTISKQLVEGMGGKIGVESRVGQGSTFWFTLNAERQVSKSASELSVRTDLQGLRALVVDDRPTNREALNKQLTSWRLDVSAAEGFDEALNALRGAKDRGRPIDFALIDHEIKGGAGVDLARAIKRDSLIAGVRVILLSTFGQRPSEQVIAEAGVRATLTKPIRQSQLYDCLVNVIGDQFPGRQGSTPEPQAGPLEQSLVSSRGNKRSGRLISHARLLVVEDNPINQEVARYQVEKIGYRADVAKDGVEALEMLDRNEYALVLMDCHMPGMDGFKTTARIRGRSDGKQRTPIIAVTASATDDEKEKCLRAGMDDFLAKPFHQQELAAKIANWLAQRYVAKAGDGSAGEVSSLAANDVTRGLKQLEEDYGKEMVLKIVEMMIPDSERRIEMIDRAIREEDFKALEEAAHGLKSGAANIGAAEMAHLSEQLERQGELGSIGDAKETMKKLTNSWSEVRSLIMQYR